MEWFCLCSCWCSNYHCCSFRSNLIIKPYCDIIGNSSTFKGTSPLYIYMHKCHHWHFIWAQQRYYSIKYMISLSDIRMHMQSYFGSNIFTFSLFEWLLRKNNLLPWQRKNWPAIRKVSIWRWNAKWDLEKRLRYVVLRYELSCSTIEVY